jgi:TolB-like protein/DNA-binding winged helix-turn-helix (wHTH) protein/Tfp pilus assembly protein PilF
MRARHLYEFGPFQLDATRRRLLRDGEAIPLTPKVLDILLMLVENSGRVVDKDELIKTVWPDTFVEEGNLTQNISILRKTLGESPDQLEYIVTVPKRGYRFVAGVREAEAAVPRYKMRFILAAWVLLLGLVAAVLYWRVVGKTDGRGRGAGTRSIAVLPFANVSSDPTNEYFSDGLTDELINALSKVEGLQVAARGSVFQFKGKAEDIRTVGQRLNVGAVLEGSVRREKDKLRVTAQLSEATDGYQLWSETYQGEVKDVFTIQEQIARAIVEALQIRLRGTKKAPLVKRGTENLEAYDLVLKGRRWSYWNLTLETFAQGVHHFEQAITKDPNYAAAYSGLSRLYARSLAPELVPPEEVSPKGKTAARKALDLDGTLSEPRVALASFKMRYDLDFPGTERELLRALELDPNNADAHHTYSHYLGAVGRTEEALAANKRALELSPLDIGINLFSSWIYYHARQYDHAVEAVLEALRLSPKPGFITHGFLAGGYVGLGRYEEAIAEEQKRRQLDPNHPVPIARLAYTYALWGKRDEATQAMKRLRELSKVRYVSAARWAEIYASLGEKELAFEWLEKAYEERSPTLFHLKVSPEYDKLRSDPRFDQLLKRIYH